jgi:glycosyltransferase involved in cell wall biosynthesis
LAYNTADVTVVPSREDNLPNIAVESIASGTPCVAFDVGGLSDIIDHKQTGYLAEPLEPSDLAKGIEWTIADEERRSQLSERARTVSQQRFAIESVVTRYRELYESVLED